MGATMMHRPVAALALVFLATGCVGPRPLTSGDAVGEPAAAAGKSGMSGYAEVEIERRIVPNGPNAWTEYAQWDEYGLALRNTGSVSVVVTALELSGDPRGSTWHTTWAESLRRDSRARSTPSEEFAALRHAAAALAGVGAMSCHALYYPPAIPLCLVTAAVAIPIGQRMKEDQVTIDARGLRLPLSLSPGEDVRGGAFFPITPGPDLLRVHLSIEGEDHVLEVPFRVTPGG